MPLCFSLHFFIGVSVYEYQNLFFSSVGLAEENGLVFWVMINHYPGQKQLTRPRELTYLHHVLFSATAISGFFWGGAEEYNCLSPNVPGRIF